ncbi:hypothetical protein LCGC14_2097190 [marine sediment metagenome]|uniref:Nuclease associated modular domain-containing protein n=1 Tax=marine sediment metagenome TaxID=412755 RepID=A0A0F9EY79_9ZZZZ
MVFKVGHIVTPEVREKIRRGRLRRKAHLGYINSPETREKIGQAQRGRKLSPEHRRKIGQAQIGNKHRVGHHPTPETREKLSKASLGNQRAAGHKHSADTKKKMSEARMGHPVSIKSRNAASQRMLARWASPAFRQYMLAVRLRTRIPTKMTDIELALRHEFKKRRLKFEMHKTIFGRFQPDFVFEDVKLIVEADGDYWHRVHKRDHAPLYNAAASAEWTVWRFAESEIKQHPEACGRAVARFIRSH